MVNFKIEIANTVFEINAFNESTKRYCGDFLSDKESDYVIDMTKLNITSYPENRVSWLIRFL